MKNLKKLFNSKKLTLGSWITINNSTVCEIMSFGSFDFLVIDMEHSSIEFSILEEMLRVLNLKKIPTLVRITSNNQDYIKRSLDLGADGIIVPMVNNYDEALRAQEASFYPPVGTRGVGLHRANSYGFNFNNYLNSDTKNSILIFQIESKIALSNLDEIFSIKYLDGCLIGPYDLSNSLGVPGDFKSNKFKDAETKIIKKAKKNNKLIGIHQVEISKKQYLLNKNKYDFVIYGVDFKFLLNGMQTLNEK